MKSVTNSIAVGDLFRDKDRRNPAPRIVRVTEFREGLIGQYAVVVTVEHWDEKRIGRSDMIRTDRLALRRLFGKISR